MKRYYLELSEWQVDQTGPEQSSYDLQFSGRFYLHGAAQREQQHHFVRFRDRQALIEFAQGILAEIAPTTEQRILQTLEKIEKKLSEE